MVFSVVLMLLWRSSWRKDAPVRRCYFDDVALMTSVKVACLEGTPGEATSQVSYQGFCEALLMLNDLVERTPATPSGADAASQEGQRALVYYLYVSGAAQLQYNEVNLLARTFDLFLTPHPSIYVASGAQLDLPAIVTAQTGLAPQDYWAVLFAILARYYSVNITNAHAVGAWLDRKKYFSGYDLSSQEVDSWLGFVSGDLDTLRRDVSRLYSLTNIRPWHALPLAAAPVVRDGDLAACPILRLLIEKMTTGLYHVLLNAQPEGSARNEFQRYVGDVFQDYVHRLFLRIYGDAGEVPRYLDAATIDQAVSDGVSAKKGATVPRCDGLLVYDDAIVCIESKANMFPISVRCGDDPDLFFERLDGIYVDAAQQIEATIDCIASGALAGLGIDCSKIRRFFPLIVTLQDFPMRPEIYAFLAQRLADKGLLRRRDTAPFQPIDAEEIEILEVALSEGADLREVLETKMADPWGMGQSFHNYMVVRQEPPATTQRNSYLAGIYRDLTGGAVSYMRSRAK